MANSVPTSALLDGRAFAHGHKALWHAVLLVTASLATAAALLWLASDIADRNHREAGRMLVAAQKGAGYPTMVVSGLAAHHARPR